MKKGIITSCGNSNTHFLNLNILLESIKLWQLPIEIFHQNEIDIDKIKKIKKKYPNTRFINLGFIKDNLKGYQIKIWSIYFSNFEELIWIDNDIVPLFPFDFMFNLKFDAIFWKDRYNHSSEYIKNKYNFEYEYESGVIFLRKIKVIEYLKKVLIMNCNYDLHFKNNFIKLKKFNGNRDKFYKHVLGDKDTFQIGFRKCKNKYINHQIPDGVGTNFLIYKLPINNIEIKIPLNFGNYYETGLIQKYCGEDLFLHKTVYENKMGEIFYDLYNIRNVNKSSGLKLVEDMSRKVNIECVNYRFYYFVPYFFVYIINNIMNILLYFIN
jgi:hypothetical protein